MLYFLLNEDTEQTTFWENTLLCSSAPPSFFGGYLHKIVLCIKRDS